MHLFKSWTGAEQYSHYQMTSQHLRQQMMNL